MITMFDFDDEELKKLSCVVDDLPFSDSIRNGFKHAISKRSDLFFDPVTSLGYEVKFDDDGYVFFNVSCLVELEDDHADF